MRTLDLHPLTPEDVPDPSSPEFAQFLDSYFEAGTKLAESMAWVDDIYTHRKWTQGSKKNNGTVDIASLNSSDHEVRKSLGIKEYWCGRTSYHTPASVASDPPSRGTLSRLLSFSKKDNGVAKLDAVMNTPPRGLYERFRRGLLEYHSEHEREYIEACRECECLQVFQPHVAEVWRLTYVTPPPTNPRTFVVLLLSRELESIEGSRAFMNISVPFSHPKCPEKQGTEKSRVRGKYVSVERVRELDDGAKVEWRMATSSDAGGNIPRFMTNSSLASQIAVDVPSFLKWMTKRFPEEQAAPPPAAAPAEEAA